jgi:hypothetical protein
LVRRFKINRPNFGVVDILQHLFNVAQNMVMTLVTQVCDFPRLH